MQRTRSLPLLGAPFRVFFLSAGVLCVLAVPIWVATLFGAPGLPSALAPLPWHQHEMIFGLLEAAAAGFLLTAVCHWTGTQPLSGRRLVPLWAIWLLARIGLAFGGGGEAGALLALVPDLLFAPAVLFDTGRRIVRTRQWRQLGVLAVLGTFWAMHAGFHFAPERPFAPAALVMAMLLMLVIGGRITPAFSGNWLRLQGRDPSPIRIVPLLEKIVPALMVALFAAMLLETDRVWQSGLALAASVATAARLWLWRGWQVRREPLLWILHLAMAWIPVALLLLAGSAAGCVPRSAWIHAAAAGAMASLILGVMSRVSLGHTGRLLVLPGGMVPAFVLILVAGGARVATSLGWIDWQIGIAVSAGLWTAAFLLFLRHYVPMLCGVRVDGRAG